MKVFISGSRHVKTLSPKSREMLSAFCDDHVDILIGDCYGVDAEVQRFIQSYGNVTVYASEGMARNNIGDWPVVAVPAAHASNEREFYRQKDIAMAADSDMGYVIWDGKSRGSRMNIETLWQLRKPVLVLMTSQERLYNLKPYNDITDFIEGTKNGGV